jgi:hypothetical protein
MKTLEVADEITPLRQVSKTIDKKKVPSPKIIHNSILKNLKAISPLKKAIIAPPTEARVRVERQASKEKQLEINESSGSIVEQKKAKIFEKVYNLLLIDANHTTMQLIHPNTANYRHLPFQVLELMIEVFTDFEIENQVWNKD